MDFLVVNLASEPISRLRLLLPYQIISLSSIPTSRFRPKKRKRKDLEKWIRKHRELEKSQLVLRSESLAVPAENWVYQHCRSLEIRDYGQGNSFALERDVAPRRVQGLIKTGWRLESPEFSDYAWLVLASIEFCMIDLLAPNLEAAIQPNNGNERGPKALRSAGWFRMMFDVPAPTEPLTSTAGTTLSESKKRDQTVFSAKACEGLIRDQIRRFQSAPQHAFLSPEFTVASGDLRTQFLPPRGALCEEQDWRLVFYAEYGQTIGGTKCQGANPTEPPLPELAKLPPAAFCFRDKIGWWWWWLNWLLREPKPVAYKELWLGRLHGSEHQLGCKTKVTVTAHSSQWLRMARARIIIAVITAVLAFLVVLVKLRTIVVPWLLNFFK